MKKYALMICLCFSFSCFSENSFVVAPGHVQFDLSHPETQTFLVLNNGDKLIHVRADLDYYPINSSVLRLGHSIKPGANDNLKKYLFISPPVLVLQPGEQRKLRVSVLPPGTLKKGTYRAYVKFSMLEFVNDKKHRKHTNAKGMSIAINFHLNTIVSIYGNKGHGEALLAMICLKKNKASQLLVTNNTAWIKIGKLEGGTSHSKKIIASLPYSQQSLLIPGKNKTINFMGLNGSLKKIIHCT